MQEIIDRLSQNAYVSEFDEVLYLKEDVAAIGGILPCEIRSIISVWGKAIFSDQGLSRMLELIDKDKYIDSELAFNVFKYCAYHLKRGQALTFMEYLEQIAVLGLSGAELSYAKVKEQISPDIAEVRPIKELKEPIEKTINTPKKLVSNESVICKKIAKQEKGKREVNTPSGRIDVLTETTVIEVKNSAGWKGGIGQLQAYQIYYPNHAKRLHLFGEVPKNLSDIKYACSLLEVSLTCEWDG